jgi:aspartyl-tRNA(Asn)/glutamyl-tRNA(Gln) amidotransferase subunit C
MEKHISKAQVEHVAWLARVELSEREKELFTKQFNDIINFFKKIEKLDTENVQPTYHVLDVSNVYREDEVKPSLSVEEALQNAPKKDKGYVKAPKII